MNLDHQGGTPFAAAVVGHVEFPLPTNLCINMMPFRMGDQSTLPEECKSYWPLILACQRVAMDEEKGKICYLTVHESHVNEGESQRRSGIHTDAPGCIMREPGRWELALWGGAGWNSANRIATLPHGGI